MTRSRVIGDLGLRPVGPGGSRELGPPDEPVSVILELNFRYPGGVVVAAATFERLWTDFVDQMDKGPSPERSLLRLTRISRKFYQCVLTRRTLAELMAADRPSADAPYVIFRAWPDYVMYPQMDRSAPTVQVDAARRSFDATGAGIVWGVVDTGIDATHPHFSALTLAQDAAAAPVTPRLHKDFTSLVQPQVPSATPVDSPLTDEDGHGTHVAGIIAGLCPDDAAAHVAASDEPADGGFMPRAHGPLQGMAPQCELVSLKVMRRIGGVPMTSSAAVIATLEYVLTEANGGPTVQRIHGLNLSLGCDWDPSHYAAGQSPLCQLITEVVASGVVVVISAGNNGAAAAGTSGKQSLGVLASITEPGHAEACITVGSTHRDAPHVFGISWTSSKGPTLDGRSKPDVVAPGEWICSAATGPLRTRAGLDGLATDPDLTYAEQSGTSMAAPHVSGVIAAFLSKRPEFIGRPAEVKALLIATATDLHRDRYAQGAGLVNAMRMLTS